MMGTFLNIKKHSSETSDTSDIIFKLASVPFFYTEGGVSGSHRE